MIPTKMKATIRDVAKEAGVSVATVSHVINGTHYVSPELGQRVLDAAKTLDYRPNKIARALAKQAIPLLALIVPDISNPYWSSLVRAVQDTTDRHGFSVIVCSSDGLLEREMRFLQALSGWVSGLILHPYQVGYAEVGSLMGSSLPVVILGDFLPSGEQPSNWDYVASETNNREGARMAAEHLIHLGHRRIGFIQGKVGTPSSERRLAGYRKALNLAGLPFLDDLVVAGDYTEEGGRSGMSKLLDMREPPTAVFCANDLSAIGALDLARRRGYRVPEDISVVGFDDIEEAARTSPPLTTVRQSPRHVGEVVAQVLIERLMGRTEPKRVDIEGSLIVRDSTAPPPTK